MPGWNFDNTYARLPDDFFVKQKPVPVKDPKLAIFNHALAESLGLDGAALAQHPALFTGNEIPPGAEPLAQAYAGHQFGHFTMLGDGRAILLGEQVTPAGERFDIQLKGSGPTPFSRRGDGRAALGPMLREYIVSEAMFRLRVPTTRSLAVATTGEPVFREAGPLPGAVLTRVAASHLRVGTFEYAAALEGEPGAIREIADYAIQRHYPELARLHDNPYVALLEKVIERQASLIARWMHIGFIHGVMNTDNMALSGETIDYGPCAFMDRFSHTTLFSSIDRNGRYAYGNQPRIAEWNLTRLAETLVPLFDNDQEKAVARAKTAVAAFAPAFQRDYLGGMREKLGLPFAGDGALVSELLAWMESTGADYTNTLRALSRDEPPAELGDWTLRWRAQKPSHERMLTLNPAVIPRNHLVEQALQDAADRDDYSSLLRLLAALEKPFEERPEYADFVVTPAPVAYRTFCGT